MDTTRETGGTMGRTVGTTGSVKYIQSIERAAAILHCFENDRELSLTDISKMAGLHKSTASGIINTLKKEKFLRQNEETGKLRLGLELFRLGANVQLDYRNLCMPYLDDLLQSTGETINLVEREGHQIVYIEKKESMHSMRICTKIGQQLPLYCTGAGKAILAFLQDEDVRVILSETRFVPYTKNTIPNETELMAQILEIRKCGYAKDMEELEYGLVCIGAPIFNRKGVPVAAISVSGPVTRMTSAVQKKITRELLEVSEIITRKISNQK